MSVVQLIKQILSIEQALETYTDADLSKVISRRSISIRCPFHDDRSPSFSFKPEENIWKCWSGCGHGDVISLVATAYEISNREAIQFLVKDLGLERRDKPTKQIIKKKMKNVTEETAILNQYNKRYQEAFNTLLGFEGEMKRIVRHIPYGQADLYANAFQDLPKVEHWLDCMVHGGFEDQIRAVKYSEQFIRRIIRE
jgi:DNA primase